MTIAHAAREYAVIWRSPATGWGNPRVVRGVSQALGWLRRKSVMIVAAAALMRHETQRQWTRGRWKKGGGGGGKGVLP